MIESMHLARAETMARAPVTHVRTVPRLPRRRRAHAPSLVLRLRAALRAFVRPTPPEERCCA